MNKKKIIFDTDPGVDDAMALLFLHASPQVELIGITTTFGNGTIETTTRNALYLKERFGMSAPVAQGAGQPLVGSAAPPPAFVHGTNALGDIPIPTTLSGRAMSVPAHRFMIETIRQNPGEVSVIAVGRMTNLALALREDPAIAQLVREIVIMGGAFGHHGHFGNVTPVAEANIIGDPHAADEVMSGTWPITVVGLDVTQQTCMTTAFLAALRDAAGEIGQFIWDISRFYEAFHIQSGVESMYVHDSSAIAYVLQPTLFSTQRGAIRVVTEGVAVGQTIQKPESFKVPAPAWDSSPAHRVCVNVDSEGLRRLYFETIAGGA